MKSDCADATKKTGILRMSGILMLCLFLLSGSASARIFATIRPGAAGEEVLSMQSALQFLGFGLSVDAKFGPMTL